MKGSIGDFEDGELQNNQTYKSHAVIANLPLMINIPNDAVCDAREDE